MLCLFITCNEKIYCELNRPIQGSALFKALSQSESRIYSARRRGTKWRDFPCMLSATSGSFKLACGKSIHYQTVLMVIKSTCQLKFVLWIPSFRNKSVLTIFSFNFRYRLTRHGLQENRQKIRKRPLQN